MRERWDVLFYSFFSYFYPPTVPFTSFFLSWVFFFFFFHPSRTDDSNNFADTKRRLVGDCAVACAFISYCGPFNQQFRQLLLFEKFCKDCMQRSVPFTSNLDVTKFLTNIGTVGDWNLQGLPTDPLSVQNGILVTQASRYPLLIDPQGQGLAWIRNLEKENMPLFGVCALSHPSIRERLEFCMQEGKSLIVTGVQEELDPVMDPVLEKRYISRGRRLYVNMAGKQVEVAPTFRMYFTTRLANPHFSPELQAKTTVVDFTVTLKGLEEQLLGLVITREQKALEDLLNQVLEEVNLNTKSLIQLDSLLLQRLTENEGNLLDDSDLVGVLGNTKNKAAEVKDKLMTADETRRSINEKREQFRPVATRGSVLYFSVRACVCVCVCLSFWGVCFLAFSLRVSLSLTICSHPFAWVFCLRLCTDCGHGHRERHVPNVAGSVCGAVPQVHGVGGQVHAGHQTR